jgi:protein SCO1/2
MRQSKLSCTDRAGAASHRSLLTRFVSALFPLAAVCILMSCRGREPEVSRLHGLPYRNAVPAPALVVEESDGSRFDLTAERGRIVLLYFGYTHCPDVCPLTLQRWARLRRALGADADRVRFVFVSVDAARDSAANTMAYARQFDSAFIGLAPRADSVPRLAREFGVTIIAQPGATGDVYTVAHAEQSFLVDPRGRLLLSYPNGAVTPNQMAEDVRAILRAG